MKHWNRWTAVLSGAALAAALTIPLPALAAAPAFSDVSQDAWYAQAVENAVEQGLMTGTSSNTFSPNTTMTRAMLATVLYSLAQTPPVSGELPFSDTAQDSWYSQAVVWATENGYISGYGNGLFGPDDPVTREQFAVILWRYAQSPLAGTAAGFSDSTSISPWAANAADWVKEAGIMSGKPENRFDPQGQATRAEGAAMLTAFHSWLLAQQPEPEPDPTPEPEPPQVGTLPLNSYDSSLFVVENGFLTYQGDTPSYVGVDVSSHQGLIDWEQVADAGVDFAMIRVGYRGYTEGNIYKDSYFTYNINRALEEGLEVGIYFYSQAVTVEEALEEARQTLEWIEGYDVTYPVVFDWERVSTDSSRTRTTSSSVITACAQVFCQEIAQAGYLPMTYGSPSKIGVDLDLTQLLDYPFWLAHYTTGWKPSSYRYQYHMWQYTSNGSVAGIDGRVDLNLCLADWDQLYTMTE